MAFCTNCGQLIDDNANTCPNCGKTVDEKTNNCENNEAELTENKPKEDGLLGKLKKLNFKNIAVIVGALAVIVVICILASALFGNKYKGAIDNFIDASYYAKEKAVKSLVPGYLWDELEDEYDVTLDDIVDIFEDTSEDKLDEAEELYGKNIKISFKVDDTDEIDEDDLDDIKDVLKKYGIKKKDVKEAIEVDIDLYIKGREDEDREELELVLVKIKGNWYVYDAISTVVWSAAWA